MKKLINVILTFCLFLFLALGMKELLVFLNAEGKNEALKEQVVKVPAGNQEELDADDPFNRYIDFEALEKVNSEISGWLYIPETKVDYPVLIGDTDQEYLKKDFRGKASALGSIFAFQNVELNQDFHVCLYGHNMISGQMFGGLKKYRDTEYAASHRTAYFYTKERTKELELVSVFQCENTDDIFELGEKTWERSKAEEIISNLERRSFVNLETSDEEKEPAQIFTLATCHGRAGGTHRLGLNFVLKKEKFVLQ